jgi:RHS repeat-associated protein
VARAISYVNPGLVQVTDELGATTELRFTADGSLQQVTDPLGRTSRWVYDANGRAVQAVAADNSVTRFSYDAAGNWTSQTNALNHTETYSYAAGSKQPTSLVDGKGNPLTYSYDSQGKVTSIGYADGSSETFSYNSTNQLIEKVERSGDTFSYSYTARGLLASKSGRDFSESYSYDSQDRLLAVSRSTPSGGASRTIAYSYDSAGNIAQISQGGKSISYSYDSQGRRSSYTTSDGATVRYSYDSSGRLSGLRDGSDQSLVGYQYDAAGRLSRETNGNGTATSYSYDAAGQLLRIDNYNPAGALSSSLQYTYDVLGRRSSETSNQGSWSYSYDASGQLVGADFSSSDPAAISNQSRQYVYDAAGNRISTLVNGVATSYSSNGLNQYTAVGSAGYSYDADGNLLSDGVRSYQYNSENRMIRATVGADVWEYEYDLRGNRSAVIHNGQRTSYLVDPFAGYGDVLGSYNADGSLQARYVHGNGLVAGFNSGDSWYYEGDAIGSTRSLTNGSGGTLTPGLVYDPFGAQLGGGLGLTATQARFGFVGEWGVEDDLSGLIHMRARQYDSLTGRFTSPDPINISGGTINLYIYGYNCPVGWIDPSGLLSSWGAGVGAAIGAGVGAVGGAIGGTFLGPGAGTAAGAWAGAQGGAFVGGLIGGTIGVLFGPDDKPNPPEKTDPLVLDLDRNGISLTSLATSRAFFDLDNNGFREHVSWVGSGEGLLVRDLNNNGRIDHLGEQFGDAVVNGFTALAALDSNRDNRINASDAAFSSLRIWIDRDGDGYTDNGELRTMADLNIKAINLARTDRSNDPEGIRSTGTFVFNDNSTATIAAVDLSIDRLNTIFAQDVDLKAETLFLPGLKGYGTLPNLNVAMSQDPTLLGLVRQFVQLDRSQLDQAPANIEAILFRWAGVDGIDPNSRSAFFDARKQAFLEKIYQSPISFSITRTANASGLRDSWAQFVFYFSGRLAAQGFLRDLFPESSYQLGSDGLLSNADLSTVLASIQANLPTDASSQLTYWSYAIGAIDAHSDRFDLTAAALTASLETALGDRASFLAALRQPVLGTGVNDELFIPFGGTGGHDSPGPIYINGGAGDDQITSGSDNDLLEGGAGNDVLDGRQGNDLLIGGEGNDSLSGGDGTDSLSGGAGNDSLNGGAGNDSLSGDAGNDSLNGGAGIDTLIGGAGDDTYIVDSTTDMIIEADNAGIDTVASGVSFSLAAIANVENLTLTGTGNINGMGNSLSNVLTGNTGNNRLDGGAGIDTLSGGAGNDTYIVDSTTDVITEADSAGIDTVASSVSFSLAAIANVENLNLTGTAANGTGNSLNNVITGNSAANNLSGDAGNDSLDGGAGIDTLSGGAGNDTYIVDSTTDVITEADNAGNDTVASSVSFSLAAIANVENLTLTNAAANGTGNSLSNVLTGNTSNNRLDGGAGIDTLIGGAGNDIYIVDSTTDVITEADNGGNDTVASSVSFSLTAIANVENLTLTGSASIDGTGNSANNTLTGNAGANILSGGDGNDSLNGSFGNDSLIGGAGNDSLNGGSGNDIITGGTGNDTLTGGSGLDKFNFTTALDPTSIDTITDFSIIEKDIIVLSKAIFAGFGATGTGVAVASTLITNGSTFTSSSQRLLYDYNSITSTGTLWYDPDGNGSAASTHFATILGSATSLTGSNIFLST